MFTKADTDIGDYPASDSDWSWGVDEGDMLLYRYNSTWQFPDGDLVNVYMLGLNVSDIHYYDEDVFNMSSINCTTSFYNVTSDSMQEIDYDEDEYNIRRRVAFNSSTDEQDIYLASNGFPKVSWFVPLNYSRMNISYIGEVMFNCSKVFGGGSFSVDESVNKVSMNVTTGDFMSSWVNFTYYDNGTLQEMKSRFNVSALLPDLFMSIHILRIFDNNITKTVQPEYWDVSIGDKLYYGVGTDYQCMEVISMNISNVEQEMEDYSTYTTIMDVIANVSYWNESSSSWFYDRNQSIGRANDYFAFHPSYFEGEGFFMGGYFPNWTTGRELAAGFSQLIFAGFNDVSYGDDWILINKTDVNDYLYISFDNESKEADQVIFNNSAGTLGEIDGTIYTYLMEDLIIDTGFHSINLSDIIGRDFESYLEVTATEPIQIYYREIWYNTDNNPAMNYSYPINPIFDYYSFFANDSSKISNMTLKITCSNSYINSLGILKEDLELQTFNTISYMWELANYTVSYNLTEESITFNLTHFSIYIVNGSSTIPTGSISIDGGNTFTNETEITITISVTIAYEMRFRNETGQWTDWETYSTSKTLFLNVTDNTGNNTEFIIFAQFNNPLGTSVVVSDSINYTIGALPEEPEEPEEPDVGEEQLIIFDWELDPLGFIFYPIFQLLFSQMSGDIGFLMFLFMFLFLAYFLIKQKLTIWKILGTICLLIFWYYGVLMFSSINLVAFSIEQITLLATFGLAFTFSISMIFKSTERVSSGFGVATLGGAIGLGVVYFFNSPFSLNPVSSMLLQVLYMSAFITLLITAKLKEVRK